MTTPDARERAPAEEAGAVPVSRRTFLRAGGGAAVGGAALLATGRLLASPRLARPAVTGARRASVAHARRAVEVGARGDAVEVRMRSDASGSRAWFDPIGVRIRPGERVRWVLDGGVHTATAYHPTHGRPLRLPAGAEPWDSGYLIEPGAAFEVELTEPGVHDYFCRPHEAAGMVGRIVVVPADPEAPRPGEPSYPARSAAGALPRMAERGFPSVAEILAAGAVRAPAAGPEGPTGAPATRTLPERKT